MSVENKIIEGSPKRGRMSQTEIEFIVQSSTEGKLTIREIASHLGRSVQAVIKHLPDAVVEQLIDGGTPTENVEAKEEEPPAVIHTTAGPVNPHPISKHQIGNSGIGKRADAPDNGNIAVMHKGSSDRGDSLRELYNQSKAKREELMKSYVRPIKGMTHEQVLKKELDLTTCTTEAQKNGKK